jgi:hypothetical protein
MLITATALQHNLVLITENVNHFHRIPGLTVESWRACIGFMTEAADSLEQVTLCLLQRLPGGAQLQGAAEAGESFLPRGQGTGFFHSIEPLRSGCDGFLAHGKTPAAYQFIQLRYRAF